MSLVEAEKRGAVITNPDDVRGWLREAHATGREACGIVVNGVAHLLPNVAVQGDRHFRIGSADLQAFFAVRPKALGDWSGVWHSHPSGRPDPSADDLAWHPRLGLWLWVATEDTLCAYNEVGTILEEVPYGSGPASPVSPGAEAIRS